MNYKMSNNKCEEGVKKVKRNRFITKTLLVLLAAVLVLSACNKGNNEAANNQNDKGNSSAEVEPTPKEEPVELVWHYPSFSGPQADLAVVQEAVNKIVKEKSMPL